MKSSRSSLFPAEYQAVPNSISLTPNFSWVTARLGRNFNRFNGLSSGQALATLRIQAIGQLGKTAEAVKIFFRALRTQLQLAC